MMVPIGMDFCGSAKSPERFEPAMIPVKRGGHEMNVSQVFAGNLRRRAVYCTRGAPFAPLWRRGRGQALTRTNAGVLITKGPAKGTPPSTTTTTTRRENILASRASSILHLPTGIPPGASLAHPRYEPKASGPRRGDGDGRGRRFPERDPSAFRAGIGAWRRGSASTSASAR